MKVKAIPKTEIITKQISLAQVAVLKQTMNVLAQKPNAAQAATSAKPRCSKTPAQLSEKRKRPANKQIIMCTVSDKLKLCSCKTNHAATLKHYWVLKRPDGGNNCIVGQAILPANIGKQAHKINMELLGRMLNEGNCFDVEMQHRPGDILELHFGLDEDRVNNLNEPCHGDYLAYAFIFKNNRWKAADYDPFGQNLQDIQHGKIRKPFAGL